MVQPGRGLPHKHEGLGLQPQHPHKSKAQSPVPVHPLIGGQKEMEPWKSLAYLAKPTGSGFNKRPYLKE